MKNGSAIEAMRSPELTVAASRKTLSKAQASVLKRLMDLLIAVPLFVFLLPLFAFIALRVRMCDGGPVFFVQRRCGAGGELFSCFKFRTMAVNASERLERLLASDPEAAEEWRLYQKLKSDPRVTPIGRFLRKTSLDELPQLINIIRGDMSVIGPRPITSSEIYRYGPDYAHYNSVKPGVSGLWQVSGRNHLTYEDRIALDVEYVRNWSIWMDISILLRSVPAVLFARGAF